MRKAVLAIAGLLATAGCASAQDLSRCDDARAFVVAHGMAAEVERDTLDEWRTKKRQAVCRITAAGVTSALVRDAAIQFYESVRANGWTRSPEPMDAPNEASFRFRKRGNDCLFNFYQDAVLFTDAELRVGDLRVPKQGETRYGVLVQCMAAMPAAK